MAANLMKAKVTFLVESRKKNIKKKNEKAKSV